MSFEDLIKRYGLISEQVDERELAVILGLLEKSLNTTGAVVEFGCYAGTTSLYIRRVLDEYRDEREFHVYDSFEGLPEKQPEDASSVGEQFQAGELSVGKKQFIENFKKAHLKLPVVHKGWFSDLKITDVPGSIAFAFLDGDYYQSIKTSLKLIENKLAEGAIIVVDDYSNEALPGASKAFDEWANARNLRVTAVNSLGVVRV